MIYWMHIIRRELSSQVEDGTINAEEFRIILSELAGKELTYEQVKEGWLGFMLDVSSISSGVFAGT